MNRALLPWLLGAAAGSLLLVAAGTAVMLAESKEAPKDHWAQSDTATIERIDVLESVRNAHLPRVGDPAEYLDAPDEVGARFFLQGQAKEKPVLLGAFCTCATCRATARWWQKLARQYPGRFSVAAMVSLPKGSPILNFQDQEGVRFPLLPDPGHNLSIRFPGPGSGSEALGCPRAWVVGRDGRYRYVMPMGAAPTPKVQSAIRQALGLPKTHA